MYAKKEFSKKIKKYGTLKKNFRLIQCKLINREEMYQINQKLS